MAALDQAAAAAAQEAFGPVPAGPDKARLAALRRYRVLDTAPEAAFDEIVNLAALVCRTPVALVSLVDENRQWFKAEYGLGLPETGLENSVCATAIRQDGSLFVVPDLSADPRFASMDIVRGPDGFRFYAGAQLRVPGGPAIGMLCVLDRQARPEGLTEEQGAMLASLARQTILLLELRERDHEMELRRTNLVRLIARAPIGIAQAEPTGEVVFCNGDYAALAGRRPEDVTGHTLESFLHPDDVQRHRDAIARVRAGEHNVAVQTRYIDPDGVERWASEHISMTHEPDGTPLALIFVGREITERLRVAAELAASERKFRVLADTMPQMVWSTLPDGYHDYYNQRWYEFTGVPEGSTDGEAWNGMFHPDDQARAWERWRHSLSTGEPYEIEYRLRHHTGEYRWVLGRAEAIRGADGRIERWFGTCTDIEEIKRSEEARSLLAGELSHRIKNIFTVIGGLVTLTARGVPEAQDFALRLRERLGALATAHEYVRPDSLESGTMDGAQTVKGLLKVLMKPYAEGVAERFDIAGPDARIGPKTAAAFALVMHEQATNAMKYGALSNGAGRVKILTEQVGDQFLLTWCEVGGPVLSGPPARRGFGTDLAARSAAGQLGGKIEHLWEPEGLVVRLTLPETNLMR